MSTLSNTFFILIDFWIHLQRYGLATVQVKRLC
jgi:hypothetical protein